MSFSRLLPFFIDTADVRNQAGNPVVAPLLSTGDGHLARVHYQLHTDVTTLQNVSSRITNSMGATGFSATSVLKVTWTGVRPFPAGQEGVKQGFSDLGVSS